MVKAIEVVENILNLCTKLIELDVCLDGLQKDEITELRTWKKSHKPGLGSRRLIHLIYDDPAMENKAPDWRPKSEQETDGFRIIEQLANRPSMRLRPDRRGGGNQGQAL